MAEHQAAGGWVRGAAWVIGLFFAAVVTVGSNFFVSVVRDIRADSVERHREQSRRIDDISLRKRALTERVDRLALNIADLTRQVTDHKMTNTDWHERVERVEGQIHSMATDPATRPDPFTGSEGRALDGRLEALAADLNEVRAFLRIYGFNR